MKEERPLNAAQGLASSLYRLKAARRMLERLKEACSPARPDVVNDLLHGCDLMPAELDEVADYVRALEGVIDSLNVRIDWQGDKNANF